MINRTTKTLSYIILLISISAYIYVQNNSPSEIVERVDSDELEDFLNTEIKPLSKEELHKTNWNKFTPFEGGIILLLPATPNSLEYYIPNTTSHLYSVFIDDKTSLNLTSIKFHQKRTTHQQKKQYESLESSILNSPARPRRLLKKLNHDKFGVISQELRLKEEWLDSYSRVRIYVTSEHAHAVQYFGESVDTLDSDIANYYMDSVKIVR